MYYVAFLLAVATGAFYMAGSDGVLADPMIRARVLGRAAPAPFRYRHRGSLATVGRKRAVADFGRIRLSGAVAWWLWGFIHVYFLVGLRNGWDALKVSTSVVLTVVGALIPIAALVALIGLPAYLIRRRRRTAPPAAVEEAEEPVSV